ncbi:MAG: serine/threonine-protein kinase [Polyangiaceae bacterium]
MSGGERVARVKQRHEATGSTTGDLNIWDTSEALPAPSADRDEGAPPASVRPSVPSLGGHTFFGNAPPAAQVGQVVQAASVAPPSEPSTSIAGAAAGASISTIPPASLPPDPAPTGARTPVPRGMLVPGEQFGVYRIGACIGEGGMARIYQAEHAGLRRQVALKVLLDASTRVPEGRERFLREARIAAAIKHPNVVNIFDVGVHEDTAFLVMELLQGTDLEQLIETRGALDESTIVDIMVPVVAGLSAVHDAGVVHRDLKPGNVFLAQGLYDEVDPKLLDFGICKAPGAEQLRLTGNGMLIGTPFYMSPEGLRGEEMTPSSDQYSLGVVMYECATGTNPFHATTFAEIFKLIGAGQYPPPSTARAQISKRLERIIMRAMSLNPADRFKDLREMGRELLLLAGQRTRITWSLSFGELERPRGSGTHSWPVPLSSAPPPAELPRNSGDASPHGRRRFGLWVPFCALAAALLLGISALFSSSPHSGPQPAHSALGAPVTVAANAAHPANAAPSPNVGSLAAPSAPSNAGARDSSSEASAAASPRPKPARPSLLMRRSRMSNGAPGPKSNDTDPEWDIQPPGANGLPKPGVQRGQTGVGANGAPIFD